MDSRTERKIDRELDRADRHHDKATIAEAKGRTHSAERHETKALNHEIKADNLAHNVMGVPAGGLTPYSGLNFPLTGSSAHPTYGYQRLPRDKKAERFEAKAVEWDRRGNTTKAQKNRDKALRHRQRMQPGYVPIAHQQPYYVDKANRFDQRAIRYQQLGMAPQAQRYQQRALRTRNKHGITGALAGGALAGGAGSTLLSNQNLGTTYSNTGAFVGPITPMGTVYKGLNYPLTGATQHPTFGYSKLSSTQKAQRFDAKAAEWEKRGDLVKAQKNREKANRYRQIGQAGYSKPTRAQTYYIDRASHFDQKAIRYQQMGRNPQALRAQQRAQRIRTKHNIPAGNVAGTAGMGGLAAAGLGATSLGKYQGLNFPYSGASNHPNYGYQRLTRDQKIQRFNLKAAEWEKRGNMAKAQKNRDKANRYRQMSQPGYVRPNRPQNYYNDRANLFDHKAARYQQWGMAPQAQRYQGRAQRIRAKHNIAPLAGARTAGSSTWTTGTTSVGPMVPAGTVYSGLSFPYSGAAVHPTYGYQRLPHNRKAERFEAKAAEWERRGNLKKAQKNRDKALRYRARSQPGYVKQNRPQTYYVDRANLFDQKAARYQQWGMAPQAQRYQGRSRRVRAKYNLPAPVAGTALPTTGLATGLPATGYTATPTYQGLNFPYNNAVAHPTYGYQRLPRDRKAERFEAKAAEWERRGNMKKATKNREKALRIRQKLRPDYVSQPRPQTYYVDRANLFDQKALQYQQWGMQPQANRYQQRATRVRGKYNLPVAPTTTTARVL